MKTNAKDRKTNIIIEHRRLTDSSNLRFFAIDGVGENENWLSVFKSFVAQKQCGVFVTQNQ